MSAALNRKTATEAVIAFVPTPPAIKALNVLCYRVKGSEFAPVLWSGAVVMAEPGRTPEHDDDIVVGFKNGAFTVVTLFDKTKRQLLVGNLDSNGGFFEIKTADIAFAYPVVGTLVSHAYERAMKAVHTEKVLGALAAQRSAFPLVGVPA